MWCIIKNEWRFLTRENWLLSITLVFVSVLVITVLLGLLQNKSQQLNYTNAQQHLRQKWENLDNMHPHKAAHYGTYIFKPNTVLTGLDDGINNVTGNVLKIEGHVQNEMVHSETSQMPSISKFGKLKSALLLQYFLPLLLILLSFYSLHNEKQSGRLKLLLVQGVNSTKLIWGKLLATWIFALALLLMSIVLYFFFFSEESSTDILLRLFMFFISYSLYYFIICGATVYLSIYFNNSNLALTGMLGVWILWTIFLPNIIMSSIEKSHVLPSRAQFKSAMKEDRSKGLDGHNPADQRRKELKRIILAKYNVDSLSQLPVNFDGIVMQQDEEYGNKVWDKHFGNLNNVLINQKKTYQLGGIVNPFISLQNASMSFAGSDNMHHQDFLLQVENYRRIFVKTLNNEHAFGGSSTGDWSSKADNSFFKGVTAFKYRMVSVRQVIRLCLTDLLTLLAWSILVAIGIVLGSQKMKVV